MSKQCYQVGSKVRVIGASPDDLWEVVESGTTRQVYTRGVGTRTTCMMQCDQDDVILMEGPPPTYVEGQVVALVSDGRYKGVVFNRVFNSYQVRWYAGPAAGTCGVFVGSYLVAL